MEEHYAILIEPPGNIQKEIHEFRLATAKISRSTEILAFPELIPVCISKNPISEDKLDFQEKSLRGNITISNTALSVPPYIFLPVCIGNGKERFINNEEQLPPAWKFGNLSLGRTNTIESVQELLPSFAPLHFSSGKLLLAQLKFLDVSGTSFRMCITGSIYRKKP